MRLSQDADRQGEWLFTIYYLLLLFVGLFLERQIKFTTFVLDRSVPWGAKMAENGLSFMKAIGIRIHSVRYQKIRKRIVKTDDSNHDEAEHNFVSTKEFKRIKGKNVS